MAFASGTIFFIAIMIGCSAESLRRWMKKERKKRTIADSKPELSDKQRIDQLERENRELLSNGMTLFADEVAGSVKYKLKAILKDKKKKAHLTSHYGWFFPFLFMKDQEKQTALAIGPGGGRDVVVALLGGIKDITAVEVNPDVVQIVKKYSDFNGGIYSGHPQITPVIAEGRNYVRTTCHSL